MCWEPGNDKQIYVICISVFRNNGKIIWKEMPKLFFLNYHYHYAKVKCCGNVDFEEMYTECSTGKIMDFEYCEEYLGGTSNKILLW